LQAAKKHLSQRPEIKFVEENARLAPDFIPNDPTYGSEWHLAKINVDMAWDISQGTPSVIVAILDSGLDAFHPEFFEKLVPGYNFFDNNSNTADVYGHGTMVAGAAAASCNNGIGVASPACKNLIMPIRVTDTQGYGYYSSIAQGLTWAVDHGAKVMNISFAGVASSSTIKSAAQYARSRGGVVVAAAGNCGCFDSTLENPYILSVSATDGSDSLASWSSQGAYVDVSAPGAGIYTTTSGGGYAAVSGTSFASPVTAGVVALMMSVNPALSPAETESLLEANTDDRGSSGYDTAYGHGRINAYRSVAAAATNGPVIDNIAPVANIDSPSNGSTASGGLSIRCSSGCKWEYWNFCQYFGKYCQQPSG
jgi:subtilisin family serine protease